MTLAGRPALALGAIASFAAAVLCLDGLERQRAEEGIDPTVVDEVEVAGGVVLRGQVIDEGGRVLRYRSNEVVIPRASIRTIERVEGGQTGRTEERVVLEDGQTFQGLLVEAGRERIVLAVDREILDLDTDRVESLERIYESDVQVFLASQMGAIRPIAIALLWIRADDLMRRQQYWELPAVYLQISKLQPFNQEVWLFNAWNLIFNISAQYRTAEEKWPWMRQGWEMAMKGVRTIPESYTLPWYIGLTMLLKGDDFPYVGGQLVEVFGVGQTDHVELAADWMERARAHEGHPAFVCSILSRAVYGRLRARALVEGDEAAHGAFSRRARRVLEHSKVAHADSIADFGDELPTAGQVLEDAGWRIVRQESQERERPDPDRIEAGRRFYELAALAYDQQATELDRVALEEARAGRGEAARTARWRADHDRERARVARVEVEMVRRVGRGWALHERGNRPGAEREWCAARDACEEGLIEYWLPLHMNPSAAGQACLVLDRRFPRLCEKLYRLIAGLCQR